MTVEALAATAVAPVFPSAPASAPIPISAAAASQIFFPSEVAVPQAVSGSAAAAAAQFARHHQSHFQSAVSGASRLRPSPVWVRIKKGGPSEGCSREGFQSDTLQAATWWLFLVN